MLLLMQFLGSNKPSPSQPALNNKCSYNSTSSHLQEARAQVPGHSIRADWAKHSNSVGGDSLEQDLPQFVFPCQAGDPTELRHDGRHTHWKLAR